MLGYKPLLGCSCEVCICGVTDKIRKEYEDEQVHTFLLGLDEARFGNVCSTIIGMDQGLPDLDTVYQKVVREERRLNSSRVEPKSEAVGFLARNDSSSRVESNPNPGGNTSFMSRDNSSSSSSIGGGARGRGSMMCSHCNRVGHERKECWQIVGFPDWWNERSSSGSASERNGRGAARGRGRGRGGSGSTSGPVRSNAMQGQHQGTSSFPNFTPEQWASLSTLLEQQPSKPLPDKLNGKVQTGEVILDTGASHHMCGDISLLTELRDIVSCPVKFADGSHVLATKSGSLKLSPQLILRDVLFVPNLNCTLLSVAKLLKQTGCFAVFSDTLCVLQDRFTRTLIGAGEERDGVYVYRDITIKRGYRVKASEDQTLWHQRLGHPAFGVLGLLPFISGSSNVSDKFGGCDVCFDSKQTREVFSDSNNKASTIFELVHVDLWGPYRVPSSCGAVYFLTIVDDYSRSVWIHLLLEKSEVRTVLPNFCSLVERQFGSSVKTIRSDNGTEFMCLSSYFATHGIIHQTSCVATPQQNGRVERKHRHILNVSRALMFQASLPIKFWGESVLAAAHIINRTPSSVLHGKTPYELLYKKPPSYGDIRVFGCLCFAHSNRRDHDKFGKRSRRCVFVGYPFGKKGWKLYDLEKNEFFVSRDVIFDEEQFPYAKKHVVLAKSSPPLAISLESHDNDVGGVK